MIIHYIQPYSLTRNIGEAYNDECARLPKSDWICITDQDTMFLEPHTKALIHHTIMGKGNSYQLLGCMTNRLGAGPQLYKGVCSNDPDIRNHIANAAYCRETHGTDVQISTYPIAGMFMLFRKTTWEKHRFTENSIHFDTIFSNDIRRAGGNLGIMLGVYIFHLYRFGKSQPSHSFHHLLPSKC